MTDVEKYELEQIREEVLRLHAEHGMSRPNINYKMSSKNGLEQARSYLKELKNMIKHVVEFRQRVVNGDVKDLRWVESL